MNIISVITKVKEVLTKDIEDNLDLLIVVKNGFDILYNDFSYIVYDCNDIFIPGNIEVYLDARNNNDVFNVSIDINHPVL